MEIGGEMQCPECQSKAISFHEFRGLNEFFKCLSCGLLFTKVNDGKDINGVGVNDRI